MIVRRKRRIGSICLALALASSVHATPPFVVQDDWGGSVVQRLQILNQLRQEGRVVEIMGRCYSACTMYLGLPTTCVHQQAEFGFHAPQRKGVPLPDSPAAKLLAAHYPGSLRAWYQAEGQYLEASELAIISGSDLIAIGLPECQPRDPLPVS